MTGRVVSGACLMDRSLIRSNTTGTDYVLPSRKGALAACQSSADTGPILITGAAGVGKTWVLNRLAQQNPDRTWVFLDCAPCMTPEDFLYAFASAMGSTPSSGSVGMIRVAVDLSLREAREDGMPVALAFDEAHLASDMLLEEVRLLANRMGSPRGLASLVLSGQSSLARRIDSKTLRSLETRLAARVHLLPLDLTETGQMLTEIRPGLAGDRELLERLHRDSTGIPALLLRSLNRLPEASAVQKSVNMTPSQRDPEPMIPAKPPLRVEDGLIEVGWDSDSDMEPETATELVAANVSDETDRESVGDGEEPVEDHYAALQAWDEWARNQGRFDLENASTVESDEEPEDDSTDPVGRTALGTSPGLWSESKHGFGPYSQLFSRMKPLQGAD